MKIKSTRKLLNILLVLIFGAGLFFASTYRLEASPALWWDEGWTLNVAKNWVETGLYGQYLDGTLQPPGLSAAFPVVVPVAISFRLFGVGVWQGRLPGVIFMLLAILLMALLARRLYQPRVAWITVAILLLMPLNEKLHPILIGRQVLGEAPALFFLLSGYCLLLLSLQKNPVWIALAAAAWGLSLRTKAQVPPFWLASMLLPVLFVAYRRWWRHLAILLTGLTGTWLAVRGLDMLQGWSLSGRLLSQSPLEGVYSMSALVPVLHIRVWALISAVAFGLLVIAGLGYAAYRILKNFGAQDCDKSAEVVRLALWGLSTSWMAWYLLLSMYWPRYLFPALFTGSIFAAALIYDFTGSLNLALTVRQVSALFFKRTLNRESLGALLAVFLVAWFLGVSALILAISLPALSGTAVEQTAAYLEQDTPAQALIESYESPLFFLLDRRWHYPPDQVHVQLNKRSIIDADTPVDYDPLLADPDYLVVGPSAGEWRLYDDVLATGAFSLVKEFPPYKIYQRVRD